MDRWQWLIDNARLDIVDFDISTHQSFSVKNRIFPFYIMSYIKEGLAQADFGGEHYVTPAGSMILIPPFVRHDHYIPDGFPETTFLWWHFTLTIENSVDLLRFINLPHTVNVRNSIAFESVFYQYAELYNKRVDIPTYILRRAKGLEVMAHLFENILDTSMQGKLLYDIPDSFFEMMVDIVEHPENQVSLKALGEKYYMNPTYISNRFKKLFGVTPVRLQHNALMNKAKVMLTTNNTSVGDIAQMLGFCEVSAFTRFFSKNEGISPSAYKNHLFMTGKRDDKEIK